MKQSRKQFLQTTAILMVGGAFSSGSLMAASKKREILGIQLYSVRDQMKADPSGTLEKLARMGYVHVEHANYVNRKFYGYTPAEFKKLLDGLGLKMVSGHTVMTAKHWDTAKNDFTDEWKYPGDDA